MATRKIISFDNDPSFVSLVQKVMSPYGFEVQALQPASGKLSLITHKKPSAIIIAAESSDKSGFNLCTEIRKLARDNIPIILVTTSLSERELNLHQKQKFHADLYLNKKSLTADAFLESICKIKTLGIRPAEKMRKNQQSPDKRTFKGQSDDQAFDSQAAASNLESKHTADSIRVKELRNLLSEHESEILNLKLELKDAQLVAKSTPYSKEFLALRSELAQKEEQVIGFKEKDSETAIKMEIAERKIEELQETLSRVQSDLELIQEQKQQIENALEKKIKEESTFAVERDKIKRKANDESVHAASVLLAEQQTREKAIKSLEEELLRMREDTAQKLQQAETQHKYMLYTINHEHEVALSVIEKQHGAAISALESRYKSEVDEAKRARAAEMLQKDEENRQAVLEMQGQIAQLKTSARAEMKIEFERWVEEFHKNHEDELNEREQVHRDTIATLQSDMEKMKKALARSEEQCKEESAKAFESARQLSALEQKNNAHVQQLEEEYAGRENEMETRHRALLAEREQQYSEKIEIVQRRLEDYKKRLAKAEETTNVESNKTAELIQVHSQAEREFQAALAKAETERVQQEKKYNDTIAALNGEVEKVKALLAKEREKASSESAAISAVKEQLASADKKYNKQGQALEKSYNDRLEEEKNSMRKILVERQRTYDEKIASFQLKLNEANSRIQQIEEKSEKDLLKIAEMTEQLASAEESYKAANKRMEDDFQNRLMKTERNHKVLQSESELSFKNNMNSLMSEVGEIKKRCRASEEKYNAEVKKNDDLVKKIDFIERQSQKQSKAEFAKNEENYYRKLREAEEVHGNALSALKEIYDGKIAKLEADMTAAKEKYEAAMREADEQRQDALKKAAANKKESAAVQEALKADLLNIEKDYQKRLQAMEEKYKKQLAANKSEMQGSPDALRTAKAAPAGAPAGGPAAAPAKGASAKEKTAGDKKEGDIFATQKIAPDSVQPSEPPPEKVDERELISGEDVASRIDNLFLH